VAEAFNARRRRNHFPKRRNAQETLAARRVKMGAVRAVRGARERLRLVNKSLGGPFAAIIID
jgi:hypothetical protein